MSIESWKKEFYPVDARCKMTPKEAVAHSLQKWTGFREEPMRRHSVTPDDLNMNMISIHTCSLCYNYCDSSSGFVQCNTCPLSIVRGGIKCAAFDKKIDVDLSPYQTWINHRDPEPMINWLERALIKVKQDGI